MSSSRLNVRKPSKPVNQALNLPSTYTTRLHVEGWIGTDHWTIKRLASQTAGTVTVFAVSLNWDDWRETTGNWFNALAEMLIGDMRLENISQEVKQAITSKRLPAQTGQPVICLIVGYGVATKAERRLVKPV